MIKFRLQRTLNALFSSVSSIDLIKIGRKITDQICNILSDVLTPVEVDKLKRIARGKEIEQKTEAHIEEMRKRRSLEKEHAQLINFKVNLSQFNALIKENGLLSVVKDKVRRFLNRTKMRKADNHRNRKEIPKKRQPELEDFKDFLEETLLSEDLRLSSNPLFASYLKKDSKNLDILLKFITHPFSYDVRHLIIH